MTNPPALRDLKAERAAIRQYRNAAKFHAAAADDMMLAGWFERAGDAFNLADRLGAAALNERLNPKPKGLA